MTRHDAHAVPRHGAGLVKHLHHAQRFLDHLRWAREQYAVSQRVLVDVERG
jgi:hypothetical protein